MKLVRFALLVMLLLFAGWWLLASPPAIIKIGPAITFENTATNIRAVTSSKDVIANDHRRSALALPGYDEIVLMESHGLAYATGIDGWFWEIDLAAGIAEQFVDTPLMPAGARLDPVDANIIYFCASKLYGETYPARERVGLYRLDLTSKAITPLVLEVPKVNGLGDAPKVFAAGQGPVLRNALASGPASRAFAFCNDLDVSADGQRIYFTEPFSYDGASMGGGGTYREAVSMGQNGLVWRYEVKSGAVSLVAQNFTFPDGILVETDEQGQETSLLVAETVKFQIQRFFLTGPRAASHEIVQSSLPAMPDGLDRDVNGNVWIGMIKQRSDTIDKIHANPWIKHLLLRLPHTLMPVSRETSYMALSPDGSKPLFYSEHDGSVLTEISVVIPGQDELYLATVGHDSKGLYSVPYPDGLGKW